MNKIIEQNQLWIDATWNKIDCKLREVAVRSRNKLPYTAIDGVHDDRNAQGLPHAWTNGFWGGMMWMMYHATGNEVYRETAEKSEKLLDQALQMYDSLSHDVGFMWHLSSGANYRLTGNQASRIKNLYAASYLASRYNITGEYIRAWNGTCEFGDTAGLSIIDCLMNLPLLYWASNEVGDQRFQKIAIRHMDMAVRDHIRPDGSVNHIVEHEIDKVGVKKVYYGQGYSDQSCWTRGAAWALYGSVLSYIHVGKKEYLEAAQKVADYFIEKCSESKYLPVVDFEAPKTPVYYDSTAGVCAACGMIEIAKYVSEKESDKYLQGAIDILKACDAHFCDYEVNRDALVLMGSERYPQNAQEEKTRIHKPIIYGDFFFVEAILKLKGSNFLIW